MEPDLAVACRDPLDELGELHDRRLDPRGELEHLAGNTGSQRPQDPVAKIVDVDEVARLQTVAVDIDRFSGETPLYEIRDRVRLVRGERAIDVGEAEGDGSHPER